MTQNVCNICGANYEYRNGRWICPACGAYKAEELSNEEATLLYNAAQKLRLSNFSEAEEAYSDIIEQFPLNANAYWGRLLAKYGIKYEDDFDGRKIPTCYAASIESVISDKDYLKTIEFADPDTREYFSRQAEYIERVRQEWIDKAQKEKPYDVFICYKDSDLEKGIERTEDSIIAQDIYIHLIEQGYRVFFSRESLRDKIGEKYEPYIFNALATAKVMLVYGSSAEYIKSTWLKNEWHRYYKKVVAGEKHQESLIVACEGFSPSELPAILSSRQCLDAKRKSFFSDLDKCIRRIIQESPDQYTAAPKREPVFFSGLHEHTYKTKVVKATCIAKGYTIHRCDCGYEYKDTYTPLVDHSFKLDERVDPTCITNGYEKKTCKICGESITETHPALGHQFTKWVEIKHPTCTEGGEVQRQCTKCGHIEKKMLAKTGHQYGSWVATSNGTQTSYCINCGHTQTRASVATNNYYHTTTTPAKRASSVPPRTLFWMCVFGGFFGLHKFAEKKIGEGILYYFTAGLFFVGWIVDCVTYYKNATYGITSAPTKKREGAAPNNCDYDPRSTIYFKDILKNIALYWRSFFTSETTKAQKFKRFVGFSLLCSLVTLFSTVGFDTTGGTIAEKVFITGSIWLFINVVLGIGALIAGASERKTYKRKGLTLSQTQYSRAGLKVVSSWLLITSVLSGSMFFTSEGVDKYAGMMMVGIFGTWSMISWLYAYCPTKYQKIQFSKEAQPVRRFGLALIGICISGAFFITYVVLAGITGALQ